MSEGKLASGMVNGIGGKNSVESHVQAGNSASEPAFHPGKGEI